MKKKNEEVIMVVGSSSITKIWLKGKDVFITFHSGATYKYLDVAPEDWKRIKGMEKGFGQLPRTLLSKYRYLKV